MAQTSDVQTAVPERTGRIDVLDLLRGIAILGTLGTNIWIFTIPWGPADPAAALTGGTAGALAEQGLLFLSNGKFLALLTLLFGIGLELQYRSAVRRGVRWPSRYLWRATLLFVEGSLHYVLVFEYDVLMSYAVTSMVVAYLVGRSDRAVRRWMVAAGALHLVLIGLLTAAFAALGDEAYRDAGAGVPAGLYTEGSYLDQVTHRLDQALLYRFEAIMIIPMSVALFLLGSRLLRAGVFERSDRGARLRTRLMVLGLGVAVPLNLYVSLAGPLWLLAVNRYLLPVPVALGLLALVPAVVHRMAAAPGPLRSGLTAVGRTALSCYVLQNVVASALCYGWGLGLATRFADVGVWWVVVLWASIGGLCALLAGWWLRHFERGPLEALWHRAYGGTRRDGSPPEGFQGGGSGAAAAA